MIYRNIIICFLLFPIFVFSAGSGEIPVSFILFQSLNFIIFLAILVYIIVKKVPKILQRKYQDYQSMNARAKELYKTALNENKVIKEKLSKMKRQFENFQAELNQKTKEVERKISEDTQNICDGILREVQTQIDREFIQLKQKLTNEVLKQIEILCQKTKYEEQKISDIFLQKFTTRAENL